MKPTFFCVSCLCFFLIISPVSAINTPGQAISSNEESIESQISAPGLSTEDKVKIYEKGAEKALTRTPADYEAALNLLNEAVRLTSGSKRRDLWCELAEIYIDRAIKESDLDRGQRYQFFSLGLRIVDNVLREDKNHLKALLIKERHLWSRAILVKNMDVWTEYLSVVNRVLKQEESARHYYRKAYAMTFFVRKYSRLEDQAVEAFQKAIELEPENMTYRAGYAIFYEFQKKFKQSEDVYLQAIKDCPGDADIRIKYAIFLRRNGRNNASYEVMRAATVVIPDSAEPYVGLADVLLRDKKYDQAAQAVAKAKKLQPNLMQVYLIGSRLKTQAKDYEGAAQELRTALKMLDEEKLEIKNAPAEKMRTFMNFWLATALLEAVGRTQDESAKEKLLSEAETCRDTLMKLLPDDINTLKTVGGVAYYKRDYDKAAKVLEEAYKKTPDLKTAAMLVNVYFAMKLPTRAENLAKKVLASNANDVPGLDFFRLKVARVRIYMRDYKGARGYLDVVLANDSDNKEAKDMLEIVDMEVPQQ